MQKTPHTYSWGLLPTQVKEIVRKREWNNLSSLKARLLGAKPFPIRIGLKPPSGAFALSDLTHFQRVVSEWKSFPYQEMVLWSSKKFRELSEQVIPILVVLESMQQLIKFLGRDAIRRSVIWERNMRPFLHIDEVLYPALVKNIDIVEKITLKEAELLAKLLPQLKQGLGKGQYLRALPIIGIDTKFLENHLLLLEELVDTLHGGAVSEVGGLVDWLGCQTNPKGWLTIRPLCPHVINALGGLPILQLPYELLKQYELPASNILVVENLQSGLALPDMPDTVAVIGGGKNIAWMDALWLKKKHVGYWGDIDTWGLTTLSDARGKCTRLESIMMDINTVKIHEDRMGIEDTPTQIVPDFLSEGETNLFNGLISGRFQSSRLEQERLSSDYIKHQLSVWLTK
ncbi:DUF3322 domain-containing protein [Xenorhabdus cabanillasii]|uniref:Wadjet protein JetD C-terminal domain-containing protein n=1 Tax=Xenorhabdus cabanillasii JM26 TaxID=1427517 RepID=W1IM05_9GAMM|nr:DUF3322 domain-containing protein [Xenorhabdus cabanillasii]PHM77102.1 hypothetical protein Xcab_02401 [Xenorhabdus cabanillasii JM26]CDL79527.1 conserved hypothetical protein [Xenorhabdus cabanillasii JM26]